MRIKNQYKTIEYTIPADIEVIEEDYGLKLCIDKPNYTSNEIIKLTTFEARKLVRELHEVLENK
jgi:hypothetical protein